MISSPSYAGVLSRRDRVVIWSCLVLITALAWSYLVYLDRQMSAAMAHDRPTPATFVAQRCCWDLGGRG